LKRKVNLVKFPDLLHLAICIVTDKNLRQKHLFALQRRHPDEPW